MSLQLLIPPAITHWRNGAVGRPEMEIDEWLISISYRNREPEHRELEAACREFFGRVGVTSRFGFREVWR